MIVRVQMEAIDEARELGAFGCGRPDVGAVASFAGRVRGGEAEALELEAYPGMTEAGIAAEAERVAGEHRLCDLLVVHRIGRIPAGETVVLVAAAAPHRREAFDAVDRMMDWLKTAAPLWKKEHGPGGARWIEPTARDHADAARWSVR